MPFVYSSVTPGAGSAADSTAAIPLAPVGRWMRPHGTDLGAGVTGVYPGRHLIPRHLQFIPFKPQYDMTFDQIGIAYYATNSITDDWFYKFGLYASEDNYPSTLIADYGNVAIQPTIGVPTPLGPLTVGANQALTGGTLYWIAIGVNQSGGADQAAGRTPILAMLNGDFVNMRRRGISAATTGADGIAWVEQVNSFPGTFPASTNFANNTAGIGYAIRPVIRRSA
jgi:hypothetical protein